MGLSIATDYFEETGDAEPYLRRIAEAGFSHIHWCHEWCTDHLYADEAIDRIGDLLKELGLTLLDLHASAGDKHQWFSADEAMRLKGMALVRNRVEMTHRLGGAAIVLHLPNMWPDEPDGDSALERVHRSLKELEPYATERGVKVAVENGRFREPEFETLKGLLAAYPSRFLGLCYDSGHGHIGGRGLECLDKLKDRLISVHLHDNDGKADQHALPFTGTLDWAGLTRVLAGSSYRGCVSLEVSMRKSAMRDETVFLKQAHEAGTRIDRMIREQRDG
jgi:sugar phosphate isomerase/epimerase